MDFSLEVIKNRKESSDAISLKFRKPDIAYKAGQYMLYTLPVEDQKGNSRPFSISSAPSEDFLMLTTKLTGSPFKEKLSSLIEGESINAKGPFGRFLMEFADRHIMIAGGIGITPFRSMIKNALDIGMKTEMVLLYSNKIPEEIAYREELEAWDGRNKHLKVVHTITRPDESGEAWAGRVGRIDEKMIREFAKGDEIFYVCGPPALVTSMLETLKKMNIPESRIRSESFVGY